MVGGAKGVKGHTAEDLRLPTGEHGAAMQRLEHVNLTADWSELSHATPITPGYTHTQKVHKLSLQYTVNKSIKIIHYLASLLTRLIRTPK